MQLGTYHHRRRRRRRSFATVNLLKAFIKSHFPMEPTQYQLDSIVAHICGRGRIIKNRL